MPDRNINEPTGEEQQNRENTSPDTNEERFESDTQKIIHRHLANEDDVITEEDIKNVRVGMTPPLMDEPTEARFEGDDRIDEVEEEFIDEEEADEKKVKSDRITPWDTIQPEE